MPGLIHKMHFVLILCAVFCWQRTPAQDVNFPTAKNIVWNSLNFKTVLEWEGTPTNFFYTVEVRNQFIGDWKKKCIYTDKTECDVTDLLKDVNATYDVRILSEKPSEDIDVEEFPYEDGTSFNPYEQTIIGRPAFESFEFNENQSQLKVVIKEPKTPYRFNKTLMTVRDIFGKDLQYTLFYRKAGSTGRKEAHSATNEIVISTSKGEGYCFYTRITILSRKTNRYSQNSDEKCISSDGNATRGFAASSVFLYLCNLILLFWLL